MEETFSVSLEQVEFPLISGGLGGEDMDFEKTEPLEESSELEGDGDTSLEENEEMFSRVLEYTATCNSFVEGLTEEVKKHAELVEGVVQDTIQERDQVLGDLRSVEQAFSDVYRKFERQKLVLENTKVSEDALKTQNAELEDLLLSKDSEMEAFQREQQQVMEKMFLELQAKLFLLETENATLTAVHRRSEMRAESLEADLKHKLEENAQLSNLTDELINKSAAGIM